MVWRNRKTGSLPTIGEPLESDVNEHIALLNAGSYALGFFEWVLGIPLSLEERMRRRMRNPPPSMEYGHYRGLRDGLGYLGRRVRNTGRMLEYIRDNYGVKTFGQTAEVLEQGKVDVNLVRSWVQMGLVDHHEFYHAISDGYPELVTLIQEVERRELGI